MKLLPSNSAALGIAVCCLSLLPAIAAAQTAASADLKAEILNKALDKPKLKGVQVSVNDGVATLTGTVRPKARGRQARAQRKGCAECA